MPEEGARLREAPFESGELPDAVGGLGDGADRGVFQRGLDRLGVAGQCADGADDVPLAQAVEASGAVGFEVAADGGPADAGDLAGLGLGGSGVDRPEDEHLPADVHVRMRVTLDGDSRTFGIRKANRRACHP